MTEAGQLLYVAIASDDDPRVLALVLENPKFFASDLRYQHARLAEKLTQSARGSAGN